MINFNIYSWFKNLRGIATLGNSSALPYKTKHETTAIFTHGHLSQRSENLHSHKNLYINFQSSFICIAPNWNNPDVFQWVNVCTKCDISILRKAVKKNELFVCETTWMNLQGIILSKKKKRRKQFLKIAYYMIYLICIKFLEMKF